MILYLIIIFAKKIKKKTYKSYVFYIFMMRKSVLFTGLICFVSYISTMSKEIDSVEKCLRLNEIGTDNPPQNKPIASPRNKPSSNPNTSKSSAALQQTSTESTENKQRFVVLIIENMKDINEIKNENEVFETIDEIFSHKPIIDNTEKVEDNYTEEIQKLKFCGFKICSTNPKSKFKINEIRFYNQSNPKHKYILDTHLNIIHVFLDITSVLDLNFKTRECQIQGNDEGKLVYSIHTKIYLKHIRNGIRDKLACLFDKYDLITKVKIEDIHTILKIVCLMNMDKIKNRGITFHKIEYIEYNLIRLQNKYENKEDFQDTIQLLIKNLKSVNDELYTNKQKLDEIYFEKKFFDKKSKYPIRNEYKNLLMTQFQKIFNMLKLAEEKINIKENFGKDFETIIQENPKLKTEFESFETEKSKDTPNTEILSNNENNVSLGVDNVNSDNVNSSLHKDNENKPAIGNNDVIDETEEESKKFGPLIEDEKHITTQKGTIKKHVKRNIFCEILNEIRNFVREYINR